MFRIFSKKNDIYLLYIRLIFVTKQYNIATFRAYNFISISSPETSYLGIKKKITLCPLCTCEILGHHRAVRTEMDLPPGLGV